MSSILGAIKAIGELISLFRDVLSLYQKHKTEKWWTDTVQVVSDLKNAKTDDERREIARRLSDLHR